MVLSQKDGSSPFISKHALDGAKLFGESDEALRAVREQYSVTAEAQWTADAFRSLYETSADAGNVQTG